MTIKNIAKLAGVSVSTVSRYFNMPEKVSPLVAKKIREVSERLKYKPRMHRPGPKTMERIGIRSGIIVLLFLGNVGPEAVQTFPSMSLYIAAIQDELNRRHLSLIIERVKDSEELPEIVSRRYCDGVILYGIPQTEKIRRELRKALKILPAIWTGMNSDPSFPNVDRVFYDNDAIGTIAADYLCEHGHREVAVISTDQNHPAFPGRVAHFVKQANLLGMHCLVLEANSKNYPSYVAVCKRIAKVLQEKAANATALFFCSDDSMLSTIMEMRANGCDTSRYELLGVNHEYAYLRFFEPPPASIDFKPVSLGRTTVDQLLRRINGREEEMPVSIIIRPEVNTKRNYEL
ncbi:MAG: LacI family DNA-binding transcriptional regulator [Victivallales bacterium]|nr:LacI family DNA-binding transcriptional regulator [Victivallales bacterium]